MKFIRKVAIFLLVSFVGISLNVFAWTVPSTYVQPLIELRGTWVSTVQNIDFATSSTVEGFKNQYIRVLDTFEKYNMNAVFFQVRPTNDAFYESEINPWSEYLMGSQGKGLGWDPLPWMVEETHKRGMEFHAWLNPYRVSMDVFSADNLPYDQYQRELTAALNRMDDKNFAKRHPELLIQGGKRILLNPAKEEVRQHIYDTIEEIIRKYDVDAIHFDDYFYNDVYLNADRELFLQDTKKTTYVTSEHKDWRRKQVDLLIEGIHNLIEDFNIKNNRKVQFGISPAAGWAPSSKECTPYPNGYGMDGGMEGYPCTGYSSYNDLYADTRKWVKEEWIDYILPQNYFELGRYHEEITDWWSRQVQGTKVRLYMGLGVYQILNYSYLTEEEYINQIKFNLQYPNVTGFVIFSYRNLASPSTAKLRGAVDMINDAWTLTPLLPTGLTGDNKDTTPKNVNLIRKNLINEISIDTTPEALGYALYKKNESGNFELKKLINNSSSKIIFKDSVDNDKIYEYQIKAVLRNGTISNNTVSIANDSVFVNSAPIIEVISMSEVSVLGVKDLYNLQFRAIDPDDDDIKIIIDYTTNLDRYRYEVTVNAVDGIVNYNFSIPNVVTNTGMIRIRVSDTTETTYYYTNVFMVVEGMGYFERYMYFFSENNKKAIRGIIG